MSQYTYTPIDVASSNFRLVRILPPIKPLFPGFSETIRVEIIETSLQSRLEYDALSYAWNVSPNGETPNRRVVVETKDGPQDLMIFQPLEIALKHLYSAHQRPIFVDQICIDQYNLVEKEHQVGIMRDIYSNCERAIIWLGPGTRASDRYYRFAQEINGEGVMSRVIGPRVAQFMNVFDAVMDPTLEVTESEREDRDDILDMLSRYGHRYPLDGITDVFQRLWFTRLWTIPEACLAPNLVFTCGSHTMCYDCFRGGILFYNLYNTHWVKHTVTKVSSSHLKQRDHILELSRSLSRIVQERKAIHQLQRRLGIYNIILKYNVNDHEAKIGVTLPQDRIFALLGLASNDDQLRALIRPNYQDDVSVIYTDLAVLLLQHNLDALLFVQTPKMAAMPSWVPDWSMSLKIPYGYVTLTEPTFCAGGEHDGQSIRYRRDGNVLTVPGIHIDRITHVGTGTLSLDADNKPFDYLNYRSSKRFYDEICQTIRDAASSADSLYASRDVDDVAVRIADGGLVLKDLESRFGDQALPRMHRFHKNMNILGSALIKSDETVKAFSMGRIFTTIGIIPWYLFPAPELDTLFLCAREPRKAAWSIMDSIAEFITDVTLTIGSSLAVSIAALRIKLRQRFAPQRFHSPQAHYDKVADRVGMDAATMQDPDMHALIQSLIRNTGRRVYRTDKGYVGLCSPGTEPGDRVVVFLGGSVPHVIRQKPEADYGEEMWTYMGEAYCEGVMEGEALKDEFASAKRTFSLV
ncbi:heterokaryon incompatibility protein-domain-containing protein [Stachybotrys elegans]|uniref:Heterokaryon incompatibility protein-domain-containing protein n=1 Tax=Stachybotrys elegans TaxID=80388 RepID=A0A8K0WLZ8_9HYPO|nr:heterokaryon incompatibility protein-domain-containing protein [Stachybotrys elegans]